jgi:DNA-binding MarR family transcriptional regulator
MAGVREPQLPRRLGEAARAVDREIDEALHDRGIWELRPNHARNLLLVDRTGTRLSELAHRAGITKQRMMQVVDELQSMGYVRRTPDPDDARAKVVRLTAKGLRHRAEARRALLAVEARARRRLGGRRYDQFSSMLEDLVSEEE